MSKFLANVLCLSLLSACSTTRLTEPTPPRPGNLTSPCAALPYPPSPMLDPQRAEWEALIISLYGECSAKVIA